MDPSTSIFFQIYPTSTFNPNYRSYQSSEGPKDHFLDCCHHCKQQLYDGQDIYMYKGDVPFCSEECRQEKIEIDEAKEQKQKMKNKKKNSTNSASVIYSETKSHATAAVAAG